MKKYSGKDKLIFVILLILNSLVGSSSLHSIEFPNDQSFHSEYDLEWVYIVGHYKLKNEQEVGMELSFFRARSTNQKSKTSIEVFPVHFAISDFTNKKHYSSQILGRKIGGLAFYDQNTIRVENFQIKMNQDGSYDISARPKDNSSIAVELKVLTHLGNKLIHGDKGISRKSYLDPKFVSNYYSITRIPTLGKITLNGKSFQISENQVSWLDHEWSRAGLSDQNNSWDWVGFSLEDGSDWMAFRFRKDKVSASEVFASKYEYSKIKTFDPKSDIIFQDQTNKTWKSPLTKKVYPMAWNLSSKSENLDLVIEPIFYEQEFDARKSTGLAYWEGGVRVKGMRNGKPVNGKGYLELKGYK